MGRVDGVLRMLAGLDVKPVKILIYHSASNGKKSG
jgi:hypothetical protein